MFDLLLGLITVAEAGIEISAYKKVKDSGIQNNGLKGMRFVKEEQCFKESPKEEPKPVPCTYMSWKELKKYSVAGYDKNAKKSTAKSDTEQEKKESNINEWVFANDDLIINLSSKAGTYEITAAQLKGIEQTEVEKFLLTISSVESIEKMDNGGIKVITRL